MFFKWTYLARQASPPHAWGPPSGRFRPRWIREPCLCRWSRNSLRTVNTKIGFKNFHAFFKRNEAFNIRERTLKYFYDFTREPQLAYRHHRTYQSRIFYFANATYYYTIPDIFCLYDNKVGLRKPQKTLPLLYTVAVVIFIFCPLPDFSIKCCFDNNSTPTWDVCTTEAYNVGSVRGLF